MPEETTAKPDPAFIRWQDDGYDRLRDTLLAEGVSNPQAVMRTARYGYGYSVAEGWGEDGDEAEKGVDLL